LIYKEAARDQAQIPAGNPSVTEEGANSWPGKYPGKYRFIKYGKFKKHHSAKLCFRLKGLNSAIQQY
jgi:hypothetical protein